MTIKTVGELIAELEKHPKDMLVFKLEEWGVTSIRSVTSGKVEPKGASPFTLVPAVVIG